MLSLKKVMPERWREKHCQLTVIGGQNNPRPTNHLVNFSKRPIPNWFISEHVDYESIIRMIRFITYFRKTGQEQLSNSPKLRRSLLEQPQYHRGACAAPLLCNFTIAALTFTHTRRGVIIAAIVIISRLRRKYPQTVHR